MGFGAEVRGKSERTSDEIMAQLQPEDLLKFGLIPEFIGRLPMIVTLSPLDEEALIKILTEPKNALCRQYAKLLSFDNVELEFTPEALRAIAEKALERKSGARGLRAIIESVMTDTMYELPSICLLYTSQGKEAPFEAPPPADAHRPGPGGADRDPARPVRLAVCRIQGFSAQARRGGRRHVL